MVRMLAVAVLLVGVGAALVFRTGVAEAAAPISSGGPGRYQVVNGTPDLTRNIMLLDTQTGSTWIKCSDSGVSGWCLMPRWSASSVQREEPGSDSAGR